MKSLSVCCACSSCCVRQIKFLEQFILCKAGRESRASIIRVMSEFDFSQKKSANFRISQFSIAVGYSEKSSVSSCHPKSQMPNMSLITFDVSPPFSGRWLRTCFGHSPEVQCADTRVQYTYHAFSSSTFGCFHFCDHRTGKGGQAA